MRSLRTVSMLAALLVTLGLAGAAHANSISATWIATTATSFVGLGTPTLTIFDYNSGATVVLQINVHASAAGVNAVGVTFQYDSFFLGGAIENRCPGGAPGNLAQGICGTNFSGLLTTNSNAVNVPGLIGGIQTDGVPPGGQNSTFTFAHMTFTLLSGALGTTGNLFLRPGIDGIVTTDAEFVVPSLGPATIFAIPEPGTLALLGLGLGVLGLAGARRPCGTEVPNRRPFVIDLRGVTRRMEGSRAGSDAGAPGAGGLLPCRSSRSSTC